MMSNKNWVYILFVVLSTLPANAAFHKVDFNEELTCNKRSTQGELKFNIELRALTSLQS
jgi:hypothetical protein